MVLDEFVNCFWNVRLMKDFRGNESICWVNWNKVNVELI